TSKMREISATSPMGSRHEFKARRQEGLWDNEQTVLERSGGCYALVHLYQSLGVINPMRTCHRPPNGICLSPNSSGVSIHSIRSRRRAVSAPGGVVLTSFTHGIGTCLVRLLSCHSNLHTPDPILQPSLPKSPSLAG
ncbi:hypothetical protein N5P37_001445, partial [Trichoderma harzianum]